MHHDGRTTLELYVYRHCTEIGFIYDVIMMVCLSTIVILTKFLRAQASELFGNLLLQLLQLKNYNVRRLQRNSVSAVCLRH